MKRRGFVPNGRTYATLMSGYAAIEDWGVFTKQLENVHSVYGQLKQDFESITNHPDDDPASVGLYVTALYISVLGRVGQHQKAFDVFHELDTDGPLAPNPKVYSSLLSVLADRIDPTTDAEAETSTSVVAQTVSEAKYVWRRYMRSLDKQPQQDVWPRSVEAIVKILSRGAPSDHDLMFNILRDFCGLPRPSKAEDKNNPSPNPSSLPSPPKVALSSWILSEVLDGCLATGHPD